MRGRCVIVNCLKKNSFEYSKQCSRTKTSTKLSDSLPFSTKQILKNKIISADNLKNVQVKPNKVDKEFRVNDVNIQMISKNIYNQLFGSSTNPLDPAIIRNCQEHLLKHGIDFHKYNNMPDVTLELPKLEGKDIVEHFYNIGEKQSAPYRQLIEKISKCELPKLPDEWSKEFGWTKYTSEGAFSVPCPTDDALIFDVEVLVTAGKQPTLACAVSPEAWYSWVSKPLANEEPHKVYDNVQYEDLIPLETDGSKPYGDLSRPRIVIGHNVSYDRDKIKEQYLINKTRVRFMDTMSMHICVSGVTSYQRTVLKSKNLPDPTDENWIKISSLNGLKDVYKLYCNHTLSKEDRNYFVDGTLEIINENFQQLMTYCAGDVMATHSILKNLFPLFLQRFPHPVTLAGMLELGSAYLPVNSNWLQYIDSAEAVFEDLQLESRQVLSQKSDEFCRLMENNAYKQDPWMWNEDWSTRILKLKKTPTKEKDNIKYELCNGVTNKNIECETKDNNFHKMFEKFQYLYDLKNMLPVKRPYLPGYPTWYKKLCDQRTCDPDWTPGANNVTTSMQITPKLLRLCWEGYPLHYIKGQGWGFLVPFSNTVKESLDGPALPIEKLIELCKGYISGENQIEFDLYGLPDSFDKDSKFDIKKYHAKKTQEKRAEDSGYHGLGVWTGVTVQGCCHFIRLPHKDGPKYKVGNPLSKDFINLFSQNVLTAQGADAEKVLSFGRMMTYWRNNRERVMSQNVVWLPDEALPLHLRGSVRRYGAILPMVVVSGTLTRRASESTWMTASNAHHERVGSELRAMVQAPPGYKFVGADVDSQELWIAALLGDSGLGICGGSAFAWAVLAGDKSAGTDLHSLTARAAGVQRDHAKVINYARLYGAGVNFAERLLKQFNPTMTLPEATKKASVMFSSTKGKRVYKLKEDYRKAFLDEGFDDHNMEMNQREAYKLARIYNRTLEEMFERPYWRDGTESEVFNKLEELAAAEAPATAFLEGRLSRAVAGENGEEKRWPSTRLNWAVQSAAADFLHLMLVCMTNLAPHARFCLSFHDEVRYLVPNEYKYETAMALQITNLFTRAFCSQKVGIKDLPLSVAFFTSVEVDKVLRKESNHNCKTPSNPHGLEKGYGIKDGESLSIFDIIDKCK